MTFDIQQEALRSLFLSLPRHKAVDRVTGVILAAGVGRRMGHFGNKIPKPLFPVLNCPLFGWTLAKMASYGIFDVVANTYHLSAAFETMRPIAFDHGLMLRLRKEDALSGPFGGVAACASVARNTDDLLVFVGDGIFEVDIEAMVDVHRRTDSDLTMGVASVADGSRYGVLDVDEAGGVIAMQEKPRGIGPVDTASCGVYVVAPRLIRRMAFCSAPIDWIDVVRVALADKCRVIAHPILDWMDAGTPDDLLRLNISMLAPRKLSLVAQPISMLHDNSLWSQGEVRGLDAAKFQGAVLLGSDVHLNSQVLISDSVIGAGTTIGRNAEIRNSLVLAGTVVAANAIIADMIAG